MNIRRLPPSKAQVILGEAHSVLIREMNHDGYARCGCAVAVELYRLHRKHWQEYVTRLRAAQQTAADRKKGKVTP